MKVVVTACDRCGASTEAEWPTVIVEEYEPKATRHGCGPDDPEGWRALCDDERVTDVCPRCVTGEEQADELLLEIERRHTGF